MRTFFALLLLITAWPAAAAPSLFDEASKLYDAQDFTGARQRYEQLLADGQLSANVFYNLGNSEYRLARPGYAALAYQRALLLEPRHPEAEANLALLRIRSGAKDLPRAPLEVVLLPFSAPVYCLLGATAFWVAILGGAALLFWRRVPLMALVCGVAMLVAAYSAAALWRWSRDRAIAVVLAPEVTARLEAADRAGVAETLPAGSNVRVLSEHGAWVYCELPGRGRGWLLKKSIERVAPSA